MKPIIIIGNWKSNKTVVEAKSWLDAFKPFDSGCTVILCAPFTLLHLLHEQIHSFELGAQDISRFGGGAYTGEINAKQLKELVNWVIIGHPERRANFYETDNLLEQKVFQAKSEGLKVVYCVSDERAMVPSGVDAVAYEPVDAIGSVQSDDPKRSNEIITTLKEKTNVPTGIYGGSVKPENVASFLQQPSIDGVIVGGASLDPEKFRNLIKNACNPK